MPGQGQHALQRDFYPRSPCGERQRYHLYCGADKNISIHALLAESDNGIFVFIRSWPYFYPRSPCGERRRTKVESVLKVEYFYPRSPCGERLSVHHKIMVRFRFLSTLSLRRATGLGLVTAGLYHISIHALLAESDSKSARNSGALLRI